MLVLSDKDVENLLTMEQAILVNAQAFHAQFTGEAEIPDRIFISVPGQGDTVFQPGLAHRALGLKIVSVRPKNAKAMPAKSTVPATIVMFDTETGLPTGILGGTFLTALRTAAGSGVATNLFARPDAKVLTVFGAGLHAQEHVRAVITVRPSVKTVFIVNRTVQKAEILAVKMQQIYPTTKFTAISFKEKDKVTYCVRSSDIIVCATFSSGPLFNGHDLTPGTHINGVGSYDHKMQEVDSTTVIRANLILDSSAATKSGDLSIPLRKKMISREKCSHVLGKFVTKSGKPKHNVIKAFRTSPDDITFFKAVGTAVQDIVTAWFVLEKAKEKGVGIKAKL